MPKLNPQSSEKYGYNNMRAERIKNVGVPKVGTDAMTWAIPNYSTGTRDNISAVAGMLIFNTSTNKLNYYNGSTWVEV